MTNFDWVSFVARYSIDHIDHGPSTARGNLYVHCPFCGASDRGYHMGLSLSGRGWGCWKNSAHRGRSPARLVAALLGVSHSEAARIAGVKSPAGVSDDQMGTMLSNLIGSSSNEPPAELVMPEEFSNRWESRVARPFVEYLAKRGFSLEGISWLTKHYDLRFALYGAYRYRIIVPIVDSTGRLYSWTARAVNEDAPNKYKTLSVRGESPPIALGPPTEVLLDLPHLFEGGDVLVVAEGPFDAMNLAWCARDLEVRATCLFGKVVSSTQLGLLAQLRPLYRRVFVMLDPDATVDLIQISSALKSVGVDTWFLTGDNDPGEMSAELIREQLKLMLDM